MKKEKIIIKNLIETEEYGRKVLPYIKNEYFTESHLKTLYTLISDYVLKYNENPTKETVITEVENSEKITDSDFQKINEFFKDYDSLDINFLNEWFVDETEKWCKEKAIYNAVLESVNIIDGNSKIEKGAIPKLLSDALSVSFDPHVGHDYFEDLQERYDFYHTVEERVPFELDYFNKITKGGLPNKTLNIALAGTGVGKSLFLCNYAASCLTQGYNVLYITMEMAEEKIAERIDANLLNINLDDIPNMPKDIFEKKINSIQRKTNGKLIIKEYPTSGASVTHFRHLLDELKLKRDFIPQVIIVDYLNICSSSRVKFGSNINSYSFIKSIAEELRGLAVEYKVPVFSATQTTRSGFTNTDLGLEDTSESFGLPATADFMFALITTEKLESLGQLMVKQLKNRYNDPTKYKKFVIGIERAKMKLYDLEEEAQHDLVDVLNEDSEQKTRRGINSVMEDDTPVFDVGTNNRMKNKKDFSGFVF